MADTATKKTSGGQGQGASGGVGRPAGSEARKDHRVTVTDAGPCAKRVKIEIPPDAIDARISEQIDTLATEATIPGFRKGKAPRNLIERRFGQSVRDEARGQLISNAYREAVEEHKLRVLGDPAPVGGEPALESGKPLVVEFDVEVMPQFTLPEIAGIAIRKPMLEVTDAMVSEELNKLRINEGSLESRDKAEPGDYVTGHAIMTGADGTEFYNINGAVVQVPLVEKHGRGMILGIPVDDLGPQLGSPQAGMSLKIKAVGPENHEIEKLRGTPVTISYEIARVDRIIAAEVGSLLAGYGFESEDQLRSAIRSRLEQRVAIQQQTIMRQQAAKHLIDSTKLDLPPRLSQAQAQRRFDQRRLELMYRGADQQQIEEHIGELRTQSGELAQRELKLFFILNQIAEDMGIKVTEAEINGRIAQMAFERNLRPDKLRQSLIQRNQVGMIFQQIREHKALDAVVSKGKIEQIPADKFNESVSAAGVA